MSYSFAGEQEIQRESLQSLLLAFVLALILIYGLLAIPFRSYLQPLIVMSAIPFGFIGAVFGHVVLGMSLTMLSIFGVIALTGVVVNDSLVMVDFINRRLRGRNGSRSSPSATLDAARFRPILLTSVTTFVGVDAAAAREESSGPVPDPHGRGSGLRGLVRDGDHARARASALPDPG